MPRRRLARMTPLARAGLVEPGPALEPDRIARYSRQLMLPGFGESAQRRLAAARVLVIGAGGLGSALVPVLAGTGVGTIGVADDDLVELSNLHRQLSHGTADVGRAKVDSLAEAVAAIDPACTVVRHRGRVSPANLPQLLAGYDLLVDGSDDFATRYLANDAAELAGKPLVWGSILRFQGQVGIAWKGHGPTFRDLFPAPPPADEALSCELGGVLPSLCTVVGSLMATEVFKVITGLGDPLLGRVLFYDALTARTREIAYAADETREELTGLDDYERLCGTATEPGSSISAAELLRRRRAGERMLLLDVREADEAERRRIPGAEMLPVGRIDAGEGPGSDVPVVVYCEQDPRSRRAVAALRARGVDAVYLVGGIRSFVEVGGEVEGGDAGGDLASDALVRTSGAPA